MLIILPTLWVHPHHVAFFNAFVGGPGNGIRYLGDSNLDWGQDWHIAADYVKQKAAPHLEQTFILPFGFVEPRYYGLDAPALLDEAGFAADWFPAANPPAGRYLLSVNALQGNLAQPDLLDWFRRREPLEKRATGYSIYVYEIAAQASGRWVAHCTDPAPLLTPEEAERLLGQNGLRHLYFDCRQGWVWPGDGAGWYVLPLQAEPWWPQTDDTLTETYAHVATTFAPSYEILQTAGVAPWMFSSTPQPVGEVATLLGQRIDGRRWATFWEVTQATDLPLSVLGHLYEPAGAGQPTAVADGLAFPTSQWRPGDRFVQYHDFEQPIPPTAELETGLYLFTDGERLSPTVRLPAE